MAFEPGKSGNPGGRPKENAEVKALARAHCKVAVEKLAALMDSADEKTSLAACNSILDRGLGKPATVIVGDDDEAPVRVSRVELVNLT